jgi:uncharacterized phage protein (TIGR01671 family)
MREILFRGKRVDDGKWVYGYCYELGKRLMISSCVKREAYEIYPETVGQYTGVEDYTGRKIFEGDLVKGFNSDTGEMYQVTGIVEFRNGTFGAIWNGYFGPFFEPFPICDDEIIITGNVHDSPELIPELIKEK